MSRRSSYDDFDFDDLDAFDEYDRRRRIATVPARRRRQHSKHNTKRRHRLLRWFLLFVAIVCAFSLSGIAVVFAEYENYKSQLPDVSTLPTADIPTDTLVYASDGKTLLATFHEAGARHQSIALKDMSPWIAKAIVSVEDKTFWNNNSVDLPRVVRAAYEDIASHSATQGASTIPQQLAKISFLDASDKTLQRKIKQFILGYEIEATFSKNQVLEMYLNRIYYGETATGIQSAAQVFFETSAANLDLAQASLLCGLPNSPIADDPLSYTGKGVPINPNAKARQLEVLTAMVGTGDITQTQADAAYNEPLKIHSPADLSKYPFIPGADINLAPDFVTYLYNYLVPRYGDAFLDPGGWTITTSLDVTKQKIAEKALAAQVATYASSLNIHDGAVVSINPQNGEVLDMVGANNYYDTAIGQVNLATSGEQIGSTFKLFTYTAAIASRMFTMRSEILDGPANLVIPGEAGSYSPNDYQGWSNQYCQLQVCLGQSRNAPAVKVAAALGVPYVASLAVAMMGNTQFATEREGNNGPLYIDDPYLYSMTLGTVLISPLELANGAATLGDLGVEHDATPVISIVDPSGADTYTYNPASVAKQVVPANVAFIMNQMLSSDANRAGEFGLGSKLDIPNHIIASKTGTTDYFATNWTVGWEPDLATVVEAGNPQHSCLNPADSKIAAERGLDTSGNTPYTPADVAAAGLKPLDNGECGPLITSIGITGAAPVWNQFMVDAIGNAKTPWYATPPDLYYQAVDQYPNDGYWYIPGTLPGILATNAPGGSACYYNGTPEPGDPCNYVGTQPVYIPPPSTPTKPPPPKKK